MRIKKNYIEYIILVVCTILFVAFTLLMMPSTKILNSSEYNIVDFEFLWNIKKFNQVISSWSNNEINAARQNTLFDFGWLIGYGGLIYALNRMLSRRFSGKMRKAIFFGAISGLFALSLDIVENVLILHMLSSATIHHKVPLIVSIIALVKFLLIIYAIIIFLGGVISSIVKILLRKIKD